MAKVNGPLMSMDASGKFGGALVFGHWKGRNTVHKLVTPSNPHSATQETSRNAVRVTGIIQKFVRLTMLKPTGMATTDLARLKIAAPSGQAWNGFLVQSIIGKQSAGIIASDAEYAALASGKQDAYDAAAAALVPAIGPAVQTGAGGYAAAPKPAGNVYYNYLSGLYAAGVGPAPSDTPPVYA